LPDKEEDWMKALNKNSIVIKKNGRMNKNLLGVDVLHRVQFERLGFFAVDYESDIKNNKYIWNRIVSLSEKDKAKAI
jgi:glutaminyl-tRNA synthetase